MSASLSGRRVGSFDVGARVGAGGMGEVYRARDTKLNRDVAIKVLLPAVAGDGERLARFRREAQVLASLSHPNIAQIHGLEDGESGPLLIMEFVDGPTLADRIAAGPLAVDEAIAIARQIAEALEAAHERGIVHRDLKPANIKVDDHGNVKILDFGLAKALEPGAGSGAPGDLVNSPTITSPAMTQAGMILGTAAYMSPEQAKGRVVDKRTDIWAFGCVLYEMLTARRTFEGEDVTETIAAVVRGEPDWKALPVETPPQVRLLLQRALDKDRRTRMSDISIARFLLSETVAPPPPALAPAPSGSSRLLAAAAGGLLVGGLLAAGAWSWRAPATPSIVPARFAIAPPDPQPLVPQGNDHDVAIAPDGSFIVYRSGNFNLMQSHLAIRGINDLEPRMLAGTQGARDPFISADGRWVGFTVAGDLRKVSIAGGSPTTLSRVGDAPRGASWGDDDAIVYASPSGLMRVPASGGEPVALTKSGTDVHVLPHVLPGSKWLVFTVFPGVDYLAARLEALEIATGQRKTILAAGQDASYVEPGYLVFGLADRSEDAQMRFRVALHAVRFDPARVETSGVPVSVVDAVRVGASPATNYSVSRRGALVYLAGSGAMSTTPDRTLVWVDRQGREAAIDAPARAYAVPRLSPDGTRVALDVRDQTHDIWIWELSRRTLSVLNRDPAQDMSPVWTPDGKRVVWTSTRGGGNPNLYWQAADGSGAVERLTNNPTNQFPTAVTPDGRSILLFGGAAGVAAIDLFRVELNAATRTASPLMSQPGFEFGGELSPDGKWLAYHSNESGEFQVYVRPYPNLQDGRWQISTTGGSRAAWARNGRELFYLDHNGLLTAVTVAPASGTTFVAGPPMTILKTRYHAGNSLLRLDLRGYDVDADGQRFLMIKEPASAQSAPAVSMTVVLNWTEELKQRLPAR